MRPQPLGKVSIDIHFEKVAFSKHTPRQREYKQTSWADAMQQSIVAVKCAAREHTLH